MIQGKTTDTLENTIRHFCKNGKDHRKDTIINILDETLQRYQWHYQDAIGGKQYRDVRDSNQLHIDATVQLLKNVGQYTLAEELQEALFNDNETSTFTKEKVLSQAKKYMKKQFISSGVKLSTYNKDLAYSMEFIFKEWCKKFPLDNAPEHYDKVKMIAERSHTPLTVFAKVAKGEGKLFVCENHHF